MKKATRGLLESARGAHLREQMEDTPREVRDIVRLHIASMDHLEVLMRLHERPTEELPFAEIQRLVHVDEATVKQCLDDLTASGFVTSGSAAGSYRFAPRTLADRQAVDALATMYNQRPVTLVKLVYDRPAPSLRSFSEAFRLRNPEDK